MTKKYYHLQVEEKDLFETLIKNSYHVIPQQTIIEKLKVVCSVTNLREGVLENIIWALEKYLTKRHGTIGLFQNKTTGRPTLARN